MNPRLSPGVESLYRGHSLSATNCHAESSHHCGIAWHSEWGYRDTSMVKTVERRL